MNHKIGLLGGTFNPIHRGHVELGLKVQDAFKLNQILYILSSKPPHKNESEIAPTDLRWKMLEKALEPHPRLIPCNIEMNRSNYSWTVETIQELKQKYPKDNLYFISGSEGFLKIKTWKNYKNLITLVSFIVILRDQSHKQRLQNLLEEEKMSHCVTIFSYHSDYLSISSTLIRKKMKLAESIDNYVEKEVKQIMEENKLYEN